MKWMIKPIVIVFLFLAYSQANAQPGKQDFWKMGNDALANDQLGEYRINVAYGYFKSGMYSDVRCALTIGKLIYFSLVKIDTVKTAYAIFRKYADAGNTEATAYLGYLYLNGMGVYRDFDSAYRCFKTAADAGDPVGLNSLGYMYFNGTGIKRDMTLSRKYLEAARKVGDTKCYSRLAQTYLADTGCGKKADTAYAVGLWKEGCEKGDTYSCAALGSYYAAHPQNLYGIDTIKVVGNYFKAIDLGQNPYAKMSLNLLLVKNQYLQQQIPSLSMTTIANDIMTESSGFVLSNYAMDAFKRNDYAMGFYFLNKADSLNSPEALCLHGGIFQDGLYGKDIDLDSARYFYNLATDAGFLGYGKSGLASVYYNKCVARMNNLNHIVDSIFVTDIKTEEPNIRGLQKLMTLGAIKEDEIGDILEDWASAIDYAQEAVDGGIVEANYILGLLYSSRQIKQAMKIVGITKSSRKILYDVKKAKGYFKKACDACMAKACAAYDKL